MAPAILKWTRSGPWGGHEGFTAPSPQAQHRPPGSAAEQWTVSGRSVDNAMNASELHSRCPDFPAPSSWCEMPSGPSFAGKPALQLLATGDIQTPPPPRDSHDARTHNSDNTTVPTATRRAFSSFLSRTIFPLPNFLSRKKQVSKKSRPVTPGLAPFDKRLDQNQKRKSVDLCPLPLNPQRPRCHLVSTFHVTLWDKHRSRQTFSSCLLFSSGLPVAVLTGT